MGVDLTAGGMAGVGALGMVLVVLITLVWLVLASVVAVKGGSVEQPNRVAQLYGYAVCLIAIVLALTTTASLVNAAFDRANPLQTEGYYGVSFTSYEAYRATQLREGGPRPVEAPVDTTSEATHRARYDALVADRLAASRYRTSKTMVTSGALLLLSVVLFLVHWRWVRWLQPSATAA